MGDIVTCKAVLEKNSDPERSDRLFLCVPPDWKPRIISCRKKGNPKKESPDWEYEEKDGRLFLQPSLLCLDTNFHTDFHWNWDYIILPEGKDSYTYFYEVNPEIKE